MSPYEEEEEGYVSGEYDDPPIMYELSKIRIKLHYTDDVRGMTLSNENGAGAGWDWEEFRAKVAAKFGKARAVKAKAFKAKQAGKAAAKGAAKAGRNTASRRRGSRG